MTAFRWRSFALLLFCHASLSMASSRSMKWETNKKASYPYHPGNERDMLPSLNGSFDFEGSSSRRRDSSQTANDDLKELLEVDSSSSSSSLDDDGTDEKEEEEERCVPDGECVICTGSDRVLAECETTGRRQKFDCMRKSGDDELSDHYSSFQSCHRTVADEHFLMFRMQVICALIGTFSIMTVRRHKLESASLFDQRKRSIRRSDYSAGGGSDTVRLIQPSNGGGDDNMDDVLSTTSGTSNVEMV